MSGASLIASNVAVDLVTADVNSIINGIAGTSPSNKTLFNIDALLTAILGAAADAGVYGDASGTLKAAIRGLAASLYGVGDGTGSKPGVILAAILAMLSPPAGVTMAAPIEIDKTIATATNEEMVAAQGAGVRVYLVGCGLFTNTETKLTWKSATTSLMGSPTISQNSGYILPPLSAGQGVGYWQRTAANEALNLAHSDAGNVDCDGVLIYGTGA